MVSSSRIAATDTTASQEKELIVRINGVLPHITKIGTQEKSERSGGSYAHRKICEHLLFTHI